MKSPPFCIVAALATITATISSAIANDSSQADNTTDLFKNTVWPILATKCISCHNDETAESGLSLTSHDSLLRGGSRGSAFMKKAPLDSTIVRMIQSTAHPRMPFEQPPLSAREVDVISRWIIEGAVYANIDDSAIESARWSQKLTKLADGFSELAYAPIETPIKILDTVPFWPTLLGFLLLSTLWLLTIRFKFSGHKVRHPTVLVVCLLIPASLNLTLLLKHYRAKLDPTSSLGMQQQVHMLFGSPPIPVNMHLENSLSRRYYRGNDERSPELFNNGNYLTCRFDVSLTDSNGNPITAGTRLPPNETLYLNFKITRGAYTADVLFDSAMMSGIFLSSDPEMHSCREAVDATYLKETKPEQVWSAKAAVHPPRDNTSTELRFYVWQRHRSDAKEYLPKLHYAANIKLNLKNSTVQPDSTLWFNAMRVTQPIMNFTIPANEWLSATPIPELPGPNTCNPELLGTAEHIKSMIQ
ncbi:MAG: hypothetical protein HQ518_03580 [Rhodopirellula sp.]|nr:hypothetical protein [Rhodopirellula sp.]